MERVIAYIDGFNLYYGISDKGWRRYLWLDLAALTRSLLVPGQQLAATKYFTARVRADKGKILRQATYLQALETKGTVETFFGRYQQRSKQCRSCLSTWVEYEEKMSDVHLASELLRDAYTDRFDCALIISADADLLPPIEIIREDLPKKRVLVAFPPDRDSFHLRGMAHQFFRIGRGRLAHSQLPPVMVKPDGFQLKRPSEWT